MSVFRMPSLGADMEAGTLVEWLRKPGDSLKAGDVIAVVETQKGAIEIEVFESGTLQSILAPIGTTVPVGAELAIISGGTELEQKEPAIPQRTPPPASPLVMDTSSAKGPVIPKQTLPSASPAAKKLAADHGIDLSIIAGTGPDGAIVFVDVENAIRGSTATRPQPRPPSAARPPAEAAGAAMRRAIAAAMARSKRDIPHYYVGHTVDVTETISRLTTRNANRPPEERVLFAAVLLKAVSVALQKHPTFNGHYGESGYSPSPRIHIGMAIAQRGGGLVAPAIHDADTLDLDHLMAALRDLVNRVRTGRLRSSEISDPTMTLTSLGDRGTDWLLPVIYPPQVAIVGAGVPIERPWITEGAIAPRMTCALTLAADHRVSDGHEGALFLREIAKRLENPEWS